MEHNEVIVGVTDTTSVILDEEFPFLKKLPIEPYHISYSRYLPLSFKLLLDSQRIFAVIKKEKEQLQDIIKDYKVDVVISDNRFGLYSTNAECIYVTHQLHVMAGMFSGVATRIHRRFIDKFNAVWVPDFEDEKNSLAGKLSHQHSSKNVTYVGALSRLSLMDTAKKEFDYLCLLSGPEPLRTELETLLIEKANCSQKKICIVRGSRQILSNRIEQHVTVVDMPNADQLSSLINSSDTILCRSGYSTLMDLYRLQKSKCILIPTPGQHEQIYLAEHWHTKFGARVIQQKHLSGFSF